VHDVSGWQITKAGNAEFNNGTFRGTITASTFDGTDFIMNTVGIFFYSGTPGNGNLLASVASQSGTDQFGNAFQAYLTSYVSATEYTQINGSEIAIAQGGGVAALYFAASFNSIGVSVPFSAADPSGPAFETWHNMSLTGGWSASGRHARYRLLPTGSVQLDLEISGGTISNNTVIWSAPTGYVPSAAAGTQHFPAIIMAGSTVASLDTPRFDVTTAGNFELENIPGGTTIIGMSGIYSLT
jgi:hypothetical protein